MSRLSLMQNEGERIQRAFLTLVFFFLLLLLLYTMRRGEEKVGWWGGSRYINMTKLNIIIVVISHHHNKSLYMDIDGQTRHKLYTAAGKESSTGGSEWFVPLRLLPRLSLLLSVLLLSRLLRRLLVLLHRCRFRRRRSLAVVIGVRFLLLRGSVAFLELLAGRRV